MDSSTPIGTTSTTRKILRQQQIQLSKSLGQNFLVDQNILHKIVQTAELTGEELVVEIGPGIGALTQLLAEQARQVVAIELDHRLIALLKDQFAHLDHVTVIHGDALKVDYQQLMDSYGRQGGLKLVANLPYYISSPLIMKLLMDDIHWDRLVIMIQKEVAERLAAKPGGKEYGQLSVLVQYRAQAELSFIVPPTVFIPPPKVESAVIRLTPWKTPPVQVKNEKQFFQMVKASFAQRRKNIRNNLANMEQFGGNKEGVEQLLQRAGIDGNRRGETLSLEEFARIANHL